MANIVSRHCRMTTATQFCALLNFFSSSWIVVFTLSSLPYVREHSNLRSLVSILLDPFTYASIGDTTFKTFETKTTPCVKFPWAIRYRLRSPVNEWNQKFMRTRQSKQHSSQNESEADQSQHRWSFIGQVERWKIAHSLWCPIALWVSLRTILASRTEQKLTLIPGEIFRSTIAAQR